jgi:CheY-like chemotaxis protein
MARPRILIAGIDDSNPRLAAIFRDWNAKFVSTITEAQSELAAQRYDVILVAVRFDESRMFDFLRYLKSHESLSAVPVICYRSARRALAATELGRMSVELAARALGAREFVDLLTDPDIERGNAKMREAVMRAAGAAPS